jgi:hypothetical protein
VRRERLPWLVAAKGQQLRRRRDAFGGSLCSRLCTAESLAEFFDYFSAEPYDAVIEQDDNAIRLDVVHATAIPL